MENKIIVASEGNKHLAEAFYSTLSGMGIKSRNSVRDRKNLEADTCYFVVTLSGGRKTVSVVVSEQTAKHNLPKGWDAAIKAIEGMKEVQEAPRQKPDIKKFDYVIVDKSPKGYKHAGSFGIVVGEIAFVHDTEDSKINSSGLWLHLDNRKHRYIDAGLCRKATHEEIEKYVSKNFPVGTYVYVFNRSRSGSTNKNGRVYKVNDIYGSHFKLDNPSSDASWENLESSRLATEREIAELYVGDERIEIAGYSLSSQENSNRVSFGCQEFTLDQVRAIRRLFDVPKTVKLTIGDTEVTASMIDRILRSAER